MSDIVTVVRGALRAAGGITQDAAERIAAAAYSHVTGAGEPTHLDVNGDPWRLEDDGNAVRLGLGRGLEITNPGNPAEVAPFTPVDGGDT